MNLVYINSNQRNDDLAKYEHLRIRHPDKFINFFIDFQRLLSSQGFHTLPFRTVQYKLIRRLPKRLRIQNVYVSIDFQNIESLRKYFLRIDSHFHRENKPSDIESKPSYTYRNSFIRKVSLKASLKVNSHRLFSGQAIDIAHKRKVTHIQEVKLKKMTPSEHSEAASSKSDKKVHQEHGHKPSLDQEKVTPLEAAHIDVHKDTPKLDAEHIALLKPKRLSRIRHARCKAWVGGHSLIYLPLKDAWIHNHSLTLDEEDDIQYTNVLEDTLTPEDSLTRLYALEEARGLDHELKHHRLKHRAYSKNLHSLSQIHGPYSSEQLHTSKQIHGPYSDEQRHRAYSKNPHNPSQIHESSEQLHRLNQFVKHNPCLKTSSYQLGLPIVHGVGPSQPIKILLRPPDRSGGAKPKQET